METGKSKLKVSSWGSRKRKKTLYSQQAISKFNKLSLSKRGQVHNLSFEMSLICMRIKNHFHTKSFALSLALKQRLWATEKMASMSLQKREGDWAELTKSKRLLELLLRTEVKIDQQLTVTIPETLAGRISAPAFFTFLNWRIASTEKRRCQVRGNQAVLPRQINRQEECE